MLVISWNIQSNTNARDERLGKIVDIIRGAKPDVLMLQEVAVGSLPDRLRTALADAGLPNLAFSGDANCQKKRYGCVIASTWPVRLMPPEWAPNAPWPQLLALATLTSPFGAIDVVSAHIPNGSGNGWHKIETFEALATGLGGAPSRPRILGGDFNEPSAVLPDGRVIPFGGLEDYRGAVHWEGDRFHRSSGDTHPRARWRDGVLSVLAPGAHHGLRHVWFDRYGYTEVTTHETRSNKRFFDHLLVSSHFEVRDAGYHDEGWRTNGPSDHSAAWAQIDLR